MEFSRVVLAVLSSALAACAGAPAPGGPPSISTTLASAAPASAPSSEASAPPDPKAALAAICVAPNVDATSEIFPARGATGRLTRYSVTPSRKIADMGNLIFDAGGKFLGVGTSGELPRDDPKLVKAEEARVAALFDGAKVATGEKPLRCK